jgi:hypothetical protein
MMRDISWLMSAEKANVSASDDMVGLLQGKKKSGGD